jgi:hypothetical protein
VHIQNVEIQNIENKTSVTKRRLQNGENAEWKNVAINKSWHYSTVAEFFIIGERLIVITRQLQATEVLYKLSTMNECFSSVSDH